MALTVPPGAARGSRVTQPLAGGAGLVITEVAGSAPVVSMQAGT